MIVPSAAFVFYLSYQSILGKSSLWMATFALGTFLFVAWAGWCGRRNDMRIVLYFEEKVTGDWVWSQAIFLQCGYLDEIARQEKLVPLSEFGFKDEYRWKTTIWYEAKQGLETIDELLHFLKPQLQDAKQTKDLIEDLEKAHCRLQNAQAEDLRFCLIFHGNATNGMEIEQREGHF